MGSLKEFFAYAALGMESVGVATIVLGSAFVVARQLWRPFGGNTYGPFRRDLGRAIILGLEFLIAGDIIRTVAVSHTFESVGVLAIIVLIRIFLSIALGYEIEGRWPWQRPAKGKG
jgi:uncharacterized membrane protein